LPKLRLEEAEKSVTPAQGPFFFFSCYPPFYVDILTDCHPATQKFAGIPFRKVSRKIDS
jgi:hypothetical protein